MYPEEVPRPAAPVTWNERLSALRTHPKISSGAVIIAATMLGLVWHQSAGSTPNAPTAAGTSTSSAAGFRTGTSASSAGANSKSTAATASDEKAGAKSESQTVVVHIAGAVLAPGIRTLPTTARIADAITAAGGARLDADLDRINLASPIEDGSRIFIPILGQPIPAVVTASAGTSGGSAQPGEVGGANGATTGGLINLNTATQAELETLPGVGPSLAQAILEQRESSGGFTSVDQLRSVHGIGDKRFSDLADKVTI